MATGCRDTVRPRPKLPPRSAGAAAGRRAPPVPRQPAADPRRHRPAARQPRRDHPALGSHDAAQSRLPQRSRPLRAVDRRRHDAAGARVRAGAQRHQAGRRAAARAAVLALPAEARRGAARPDDRPVGAGAARRQRADPADDGALVQPAGVGRAHARRTRSPAPTTAIARPRSRRRRRALAAARAGAGAARRATSTR